MNAPMKRACGVWGVSEVERAAPAFIAANEETSREMDAIEGRVAYFFAGAAARAVVASGVGTLGEAARAMRDAYLAASEDAP